MNSTKLIHKLPHESIVKLTDELVVQPTEIISMSLVQRSDLNVTLFAVGKGEEINKHTSPGDAMVTILEGMAEIVIGEQTYTVQSEETIIMPANIPHALKAIESFKMLLIVVKPTTDNE